MFSDYQKAVHTAIEVLQDFEIRSVPVDPMIIVNQMSRTIRCEAYSVYMEKYGCTLQDVEAFADSEDGVCFYKPSSEKYLILYNDVDPNKRLRKRFTVAHELGHIFLEHLTKSGTTIMHRGEMSDEEYKAYEREADVFARNLLSPAPLADMIMKISPDGWKNRNIETAFSISNRAANVRINFLITDLRSYNSRMMAYTARMTLLFRKVCLTCGSEVPFDSGHCELCGSTSFSYANEYTALPQATPIAKKSGRMRQCPRCGNKEISSEARFCRICGLPIRNICTGAGKKHANRSYARYCSECGAPTVYGKLLSFNNERTEEMIYADGVNFDQKTNRVKICPRCFNQQFSSAARYCRICGTELYNICIGDPAEEGYENDPNRINQHSNPSNARYCETCGKPTEFFLKGILPKYEEYQMKTAEEEVQMGLCENVDEALQGMRSDTTKDAVPTEDMPFPDQPDDSEYASIPGDPDYPQNEATTIDGVNFQVETDDSSEFPFS